MKKHPSSGLLKGRLIRLTNLYDVTAKQFFVYVRSLHSHIRKQNGRIRRLRRKIAELRKFRKQHTSHGKAVVVEESEEDDVLKALELAEEQQAHDLKASEPLDVKAFVDDIKKTAQEFNYQNRYIYEPTSGLYYDPETGYYYNAIYGLHYDGQKGCYLKYNEQTGQYDFYSQVIPEETLEKEKPKTYQKKRKRERAERDSMSADERVKHGRDRRCSRSPSHEKDSKRHRRHRRRHKNRRSRSRSNQSVSSRSSSSSGEGENSKRRRKKKEKEEKKRKKKEKRRKAKLEHSDDNKEDGELDSSSDSDESDNKERKVITIESSASEKENPGIEIDLDKYADKHSDISRKYPPSLRLIVQESSVASLKEGSLFIITCNGGSLGREGDHDVIIPDINVSKYHLKFSYNTRTSAYQLLDLGSRNGTFLNGTRMAPTMQESDLFDIVHGDVIDLTRTKLLCHIHDGNYTCGNCEPGLLMKTSKKGTASDDERITKPVSYKEGKKLLQRRFGLEDEKYVKKSGPAPEEYNDRAAHRRKVKGSSNEHAKTEMASLNEQINSKNKGFKMLSKLGWSEGRSLGIRDQGPMEPIRLKTNIGTSGLGSQALADPTAMPDEAKMNIWKMAQERYKACAEVEEDGMKVPAASMEQHISSENRGFQMLSKLGWVSGETLGKEGGDGLKEPLKLLTNVGTSGLGSQPLKKPGNENIATAKNKTIWKKRQNKCRSMNMFEASDSD
ncbi:angiogenic factor with G patch and FHA domains 1 isoform X2 [Armigeres subalbatus]|uniref:angiogenic factor with G patch and FHA domains 1 isoform X2 n=1 Tax=Armigeres subalbatus TaxID=124917 RepID=UPI002ED3FC53